MHKHLDRHESFPVGFVSGGGDLVRWLRSAGLGRAPPEEAEIPGSRRRLLAKGDAQIGARWWMRPQTLVGEFDNPASISAVDQPGGSGMAALRFPRSHLCRLLPVRCDGSSAAFPPPTGSGGAGAGAATLGSRSSLRFTDLVGLLAHPGRRRKRMEHT